MASQDGAGFDFETFQDNMDFQLLTDAQKELLKARLELLEDFVRPREDSANQNELSSKPSFANNKQGKEKESQWEKRNSENLKHRKLRAAIARPDTWSFQPGSLTIVVSGPSRPTLS